MINSIVSFLKRLKNPFAKKQIISAIDSEGVYAQTTEMLKLLREIETVSYGFVEEDKFER